MMQRFSARVLLLAALGNLVFFPNATATTNSNLTVSIEGLRNQKGQICLSLFSSSRGFPNNAQRAVQSRCVQIGSNPVTVNFGNLRAGNYAVALIHDANKDGKLNTNGIGIPTEGFGFSRNPAIRTGAPKFGDSAVFVAGPSTNIQIRLQYLL
jgi:uncharacterized protein (DUF2141 family)